MNKRLDRFNSLRSHPLFGSYFRRLKKDELSEVEKFIRDREALDDNQYMFEANRFKLDQPKNMKAYSLQWALLTQSVDTVSNKPRRRK